MREQVHSLTAPASNCLIFRLKLFLHTDGTDVLSALSLHLLALRHGDTNTVAVEPLFTLITAYHEPRDRGRQF